ITNIENPDEMVATTHRILLTETIVEKDIDAQETCHMLLELPLVENSRVFINLNVSREVFKPVTKTNEDDHEEH
ncbi:hypothetical protein KI387_037823, partial [Taxus chinensis]